MGFRRTGTAGSYGNGYRAADDTCSAADWARDAKTMIAEAVRCGAALVHYSTDYVFNGVSDLAWREDDECDPVNFYGASKLAGEEAIRALRSGGMPSGARIVAISSDEGSNERMLAAGADDALPKTHVKGYLSRLSKLK